MRTLENRLLDLEAEVAARRYARRRSDGFDEQRIIEALERLEAERAAYAAADTAGKIAINRQRIAKLEASHAERSPYRQRLMAYEVLSLEITILDLEGRLTPEQLWVAAYQTAEAVRFNTPWPPIRTHEQALEVIESGEIDYASQPESLKGCRAGKYEEPLTGTLVAPNVGPQRRRPKLKVVEEEAPWWRGNEPQYFEPDRN